MSDICATCGKTHPWPDGNTPRHPFNDGILGGKQALPKAQKVQPQQAIAPWPCDPVLRQALIDKGVLTSDDLRDAEAKILVVSGQFQQAVRGYIADGQ